ncbi:MAG TPA: hypothetical protein PLB52_01060, partial [Candidatus Moranbacteria bacterium]|nr:hypothetical protein [Candidatus Moranbacteria bacterium]
NALEKKHTDLVIAHNKTVKSVDKANTKIGALEKRADGIEKVVNELAGLVGNIVKAGAAFALFVLILFGVVYFIDIRRKTKRLEERKEKIKRGINPDAEGAATA